jgi:hypothetical protein
MLSMPRLFRVLFEDTGGNGDARKARKDKMKTGKMIDGSPGHETVCEWTRLREGGKACRRQAIHSITYRCVEEMRARAVGRNALRPEQPARWICGFCLVLSRSVCRFWRLVAPHLRLGNGSMSTARPVWRPSNFGFFAGIHCCRNDCPGTNPPA